MSDWNSQTALVVEDSAVQRAHLVLLLEAAGFGSVLEAPDGREALRILGEPCSRPISVVLTDLDMPEMDGIELIRHLSERQARQNLIVTSGRDPRMLEIVERVVPDDASIRLIGTLSKPVRMEQLSALLAELGKEAKRGPGDTDSGAASIDAAEIEAAIRAEQFVPFFQPKVDMKTGRIKGLEALARWNHPERGIVAPAEFIPAIEGTPMMEPFTLSIARQTLSRLASWRPGEMPAMTVSINLSADNLAARDFIDRLASLATDHDIPARSLIWEVTETAVMGNVRESLANLARLGLKGFGLAMDDYGIGYSSIQLFSRCPFTELKIDRAFVRGAVHRANRRAVLESAIDMGRSLGVTTVAEGVESQSDWDLLCELGCDLAQGYLIAKPMPAHELPQWVRTNRERLAGLAGAPQRRDLDPAI
jgi:EAL domain-containing protein (putative c-di-GMP-specific phosphodiesterase class I)/ActR/RegA family two-component response regulator